MCESPGRKFVRSVEEIVTRLCLKPLHADGVTLVGCHAQAATAGVVQGAAGTTVGRRRRRRSRKTTMMMAIA